MKALVEADLKGFSELYAQRRIIAVRQAFERRAVVTDKLRMLLLLLDKKDKKLADNIKQWPDRVPRDNSWQTFTLAFPGKPPGRYFGAGAQLPGPFPILVARSLAPRDALLFQLRWAMAVVLAAILIGGTLLGNAFGRRILARISRLNEVCERVEQGALETRVEDDSRDEFGTLGQHINRMLARISALAAGAREISDHIAHELRTPLNRILLWIENMHDGSTKSSLTRELDEICTDMKEAIAIFEALLDIATTEAEAGDLSTLKPVDLADIASEMAELYAAVAEERNIALALDLDKPAMILGDENLPSRALANLLDNAIKFSPDGGDVQITLARQDHHYLLEIEDSGPGLDANIEGRAFERFVRGGNFVKTQGHGLAIVRAIAIRHGIKIALANKSKGLCVTLRCPAWRNEQMGKS